MLHGALGEPCELGAEGFVLDIGTSARLEQRDDFGHEGGGPAHVEGAVRALRHRGGHHVRQARPRTCSTTCPIQSVGLEGV